MIRAKLSSAAERDILRAQRRYAKLVPGLDLDFRDELDRTLELIREYPAGFPILYQQIRRANLRRFPFGVFYVQRRDHVFVLGVVHHARDPQHWKSRA